MRLMKHATIRAMRWFLSTYLTLSCSQCIMPKGKKKEDHTPRASPYKKHNSGSADESTSLLCSATRLDSDKGSISLPSTMPSLPLAASIGNNHPADGKVSLPLLPATPSLPVLVSNNPPAQRTADRKVRPLHFFYETRSTFFSVHADHITEMAATVEDSTRTATESDFASSVFTSSPSDPEGN